MDERLPVTDQLHPLGPDESVDDRIAEMSPAMGELMSSVVEAANDDTLPESVREAVRRAAFADECARMFRVRSAVRRIAQARQLQHLHSSVSGH